jgi:hypothetical protein
MPYLGDVIGPPAKAIDSRISKSRVIFNNLYHRLWKRSDISVGTKLRIHRSVIIPCLTYALETHALRKPVLHKCNTFVYRHLRLIFSYARTDHVYYDELNGRIAAENVSRAWPSDVVVKNRLQLLVDCIKHDLADRGFPVNSQDKRPIAVKLTELAENREAWRNMWH